MRIISKKKNGNSVFKLTIRSLPHLCILVICFLWIIPSLGLLVSSFRPTNLTATTGWWTAFKTPFTFTLENYRYVINRSGMGRSFINSLLIAVPSTIMPIMIAAFAAYALAWMKVPGRDFLFLSIVALMVVPLQMTLIPILRIFNRLKLTGSLPGIWIVHSGYGLPFAVYLLRNFIGQLPNEMFESATIDGASHFTTFFRLVLPTSIPAIASLAIFQFLWVWNDLLVALIYLGGSPAVAPMTITISNLVSSRGGGWEYLTAAAFISMMLPLIVFFSLQKYFIRGILAGSVKG
ncbi:MAG: carbohydrate ABC transporter permease [Spirochaetota bacterium]